MKPATDEELEAFETRQTTTLTEDRRAIYNLGVEHGRQQAAEDRPLWPDPITDRPPTEADGDKNGYVQIFEENVWKPFSRFDAAECGIPWRHTPRWQPKPLHALGRRWWFTPKRTWSRDLTRAWVAPGWRLRNEARRMRRVPMEVQRTQQEK